MKPDERLKRAAKRYTDARTERDKAIREAAAAGMTRRAIGEIVGLSYARVQQIVASENE